MTQDGRNPVEAERGSLSGSFNLGQIALSKLSELAAQVETLEAAKSYLQGQLAERETELAETSRSILRIHAAYENRIAELERDVDEVRGDNDKLRTSLISLEQAHAELREAPGGPDELRGELDGARQELERLRASDEEQRKLLAQRDKQLAELKVVAAQLVKEQDQRERRVRTAFSTLQGQLSNLQAALLPDGMAPTKTSAPEVQQPEKPDASPARDALNKLLAGEEVELLKRFSSRGRGPSISPGSKRGGGSVRSPRERARLARGMESEEATDDKAAETPKARPTISPPARTRAVQQRMKTIDKLAEQALAGSMSAVDTGEFPVPGYTPQPKEREEKERQAAGRRRSSGVYGWAAIFLAIIAGSMFLLKGLIFDESLQSPPRGGLVGQAGGAGDERDIEPDRTPPRERPASPDRPRPASPTEGPGADVQPAERPRDPIPTPVPTPVAVHDDLPADLDGLIVALKEAISASDSARVEQIEAALFAFGNPALPSLTGLLRSERNVLVKASLVRVITDIRNNKDVSELTHLIRTGDPASRLRATLDLAKVQDPQAVPQLLEVARNFEEETVRKSALTALGNIHSPEAVAGLTDLAQNHTDVDSRVSAMLLLAQKKDPGSAGVFEGLTSDPDRKVRRAAFVSLGNLGAKNAVQTVINAIHTEPDAEVRGEAVRTLGKIGDPNQLRMLNDLKQNDADKAVRSHARDAIQRIEMQIQQ